VLQRLKRNVRRGDLRLFTFSEHQRAVNEAAEAWLVWWLSEIR